MKPPRPQSRRRSREAALQVLYALDSAPGAGGRDAGEVFAGICDHFELPEGARAFAKQLVEGVAASRAELDARIAAHSANWRVERMAVVDRNVLRLAAFELLHTDTAPQVVIDEAVELCHRFAGERSPGFVNGVLDALARSEGMR